MKRRFLFTLASVAGALAIFSSCQKQIDVTRNADEVMGTPLPTTGMYCRIESIWQNPHEPDQQFWLIGYDEFENPTFISTPSPGTGTPFRTFKYDQWHRLREYRGEHANGNYETWSFYGYDLNGRIGYDTTYALGAMGPDGPLTYFQKTITQYEYDSQGRMIRAFGHVEGGGSFDNHYMYDAAGNLVRPGVTYDDKVNMNRTNDIWMFLRRDYSMNNPFWASEYNAAGFPTIIDQPAGTAQWIIGDISDSQIGYACRQSFYH